jgi:hypothetical protein
VPGDTAEHDPHPHARLHGRTLAHQGGLEADVVGLLQHGHAPAAVEGDVELARQAEERAVVEDMEVPGAGKRARVDQLLRIDPRGRRAGDVADVVGAGALGAQAEVLDAL